MTKIKPEDIIYLLKDGAENCGWDDPTDAEIEQLFVDFAGKVVNLKGHQMSIRSSDIRQAFREWAKVKPS